MNKLLLSVLVITYNQENYIKQTLDSIISQKHDFPYEIVIGEDCSTDNTRNIIKEYELQYPDIIKPIYNEHNLGLLKNFFNTLSHCSGKYIMECAGDDYWLPGKVKKQISFMEKHKKFGLCYSKALKYEQIINKFSNTLNGIKRTSFNQLILNNSWPAVTVCYKNSLVNKYIKEINPISKNWLMEDYPMWLWFCMNTKIHFFNYPMAVYRIISGSISHFTDLSKQQKFENNVSEVRNFYINYYNKQNEYENYVNTDIFNNAWVNKDKQTMLTYWPKLTNIKWKLYIKYFLIKILY